MQLLGLHKSVQGGNASTAASERLQAHLHAQLHADGGVAAGRVCKPAWFELILKEVICGAHINQDGALWAVVLLHLQQESSTGITPNTRPRAISMRAAQTRSSNLTKLIAPAATSGSAA